MKKLLLLPILAVSLLCSAPALLHADEADLTARMKKIEENQQRILTALDEIKSELQIVKIRATNG